MPAAETLAGKHTPGATPLNFNDADP
jgi:hypothetical protein